LGKSGFKKKMIKKLEKMGQRPLLLQPPETLNKFAETPQFSKTLDITPGTLEILITKLLEHEFSRIVMKRA
jgi:hypothetical protein